MFAIVNSSDLPVIIAGVILLASTLGAQIVNIIMARRGAKQSIQNSKEIAQNAADLAEVKTQGAVIVGHVNSEKTAAEGRETTLRKENDLLREMLTEKKQTAALLAQAVSTTQSVVTTPRPVQVVNQQDAPVPTTSFQQPK